jgi:DNA recombination-dependent growth factor C
MHFYAMSDREILSMPLKRFWMLSKNVDRIAAEFDYRNAIVAISAGSSEGVESLMTNLKKQMGSIVEIDEAKMALSETYDRDGLLSLRGLGRVG